MNWELLVSYNNQPRRKIVTWTGRDGEDAARRLVDAQRSRGPTVWASRPADRHGIFTLGGGTIIG